MFNKELYLYINSFAGKNAWVDSFGIFLAEYVIYGFILVEVYLYFFKKLKNEAIYAFYSAMFGLLINQIIELFYFHNRPFMDNLGVTLKKHLAENSFPSDHTTFMVSIAFSLLLYKKTKKYGAVLIILGLISGFSRVFIGVHYPYDILGATLVGMFGASVIYLLRKRLSVLNIFINKLVSKIFMEKI